MRVYTLPYTSHPLKDERWYEEEKERNSEDEFAREVLISYDFSVGNIVFKEFRSQHILKGSWKPNPFLPVIRYFDYGRVNCTTFSQKDNMGRIVFFKEIVLEKSSTHEQAAAAIAYSANLECKGFIDYDDPAGEYKDQRSNTTDVEILESHGINPTHAKSKSDNRRKKNRVELTKLKLSQRIDNVETIMVHESCITTLEAMVSGYRYKLDVRGMTTDTIEEEHPYEDVIDCLCGTILEEFSVENVAGKIKRDQQSTGYRDRYTGYGRG